MNVAMDPLRAAAYFGILVAFCAVFSLIWLEVGGLGPGKVAKQLMIAACKSQVIDAAADPSKPSSNATSPSSQS